MLLLRKVGAIARRSLRPVAVAFGDGEALGPHEHLKSSRIIETF